MLYWIIALFHLVIVPFAAIHALTCKRDHRAALGWIGVILLFPIAGPLLYFTFGINRLRTKARLFTGHHLPVMYLDYERTSRPDKHFRDPLVAQLSKPHLAIVGGRATSHPLIPGNKITVLHNGDAFFPRLIECIDAAQQHVFVSSYLFSNRGIAGNIVDALIRASDRGVTVRVLIDGIGALYSFRCAVRRLRKAGVEVAMFTPPRLLPPSIDINMRNHRKLAIVDDHSGFFGGINIDARHLLEDERNRHPTEDIHFEAHGPLVSALHSLFCRDWLMVTNEALPPVEPTGPEGHTTCRLIDDGPDDSLNHLAMTLMGVFSAARSDILIMMPYFLPNHEIVASLQAAVLRGVRVRVLIPERSNLPYVDWATRNMLWELLLWNIEVYYKPAPFAHTKLIVVDQHYVMAGSANMDARSLRLNFELGVEIFDSLLATQLHAQIRAKMNTSRKLSLEDLDQRPFWQRLRDAFFWLFSSYL